jgi:hypothetical protein
MIPRHILQVISWLACFGTVLPSVLYLCNVLTIEQTHWGMLVATLAWFIATPLWMGRETPSEAATPQD